MNQLGNDWFAFKVYHPVSEDINLMATFLRIDREVKSGDTAKGEVGGRDQVLKVALHIISRLDDMVDVKNEI